MGLKVRPHVRQMYPIELEIKERYEGTILLFTLIFDPEGGCCLLDKRDDFNFRV